MDTRTLLLVITLCTLVLPFAASAQPGPEDENARQRIEEFRRLKLIEVLDLDEEQAVRLMSREKDFRKQEKVREKKREELMAELKELVNSDAHDDRIRQQIETLSEFNQSMMKAREDFVFSLSDILSMKQLGKLVLFEQRFSRELRKMILDRARGPRPRP
jgi:Spy/CpxP family protein refolding chaperone